VFVFFSVKIDVLLSLHLYSIQFIIACCRIDSDNDDNSHGHLLAGLVDFLAKSFDFVCLSFEQFIEWDIMEMAS